MVKLKFTHCFHLGISWQFYSWSVRLICSVAPTALLVILRFCFRPFQYFYKNVTDIFGWRGWGYELCHCKAVGDIILGKKTIWLLCCCCYYYCYLKSLTTTAAGPLSGFDSFCGVEWGVHNFGLFHTAALPFLFFSLVSCE